MENRKFIKYIPILALGFFVLAPQAFAYEMDTHAFLTNEIVKFYNKNFPSQKISSELTSYIVDGARLEDNLPRYLNHFYDPVNNRGLDDLGFKGIASKDWAENKSAQTAILYRLMPQTEASLLSAAQIDKIKPVFKQTDFTWQKAVDLYAQGDTEAAFFALGHVLHLMEDASVPDHTRNDAHPPFDDGGSPYENWTKQFTLANPDSGLASRLRGKKPLTLSNLADYFDAMAKYSNNNFYSKDSIKNYDLPEPDYFGPVGRYLYGFKKDLKDGDYKLAFYPNGDPDETVSWSFKGEPILIDKQGNLVLKDYWHRLSVKAVQYGAGVMNLFFKEAEAAKQKYATAKVQRPYLATLMDGLRTIFGGAPAQDPSDLINQFKKPVAEINLDEKPILDEAKVIEEAGRPIASPSAPEEDILNTPSSASDNPPVAPEPAPFSASQTASLNQQVVFSGQSDNAPTCKFNANLNPSNQKLIINEVAWMGTAVSASNEWIELKNISGGALNISGWRIIDKGEQLKFTFNDGTIIPAGGYVLLERTDDDSVPFVKADGVYTGALSNSDEGLQLFDKNCNLTDEVLADPNWPAGDNAEKRTMERSADLSWHTYNGTGVNGIFGTPKAENSQPQTTTTPQQEPQPEPEPQPEVPPADQPAPQVSAGHAVISEFLFDAVGSDAGKEFIELYNPTNKAVDLSGWSIRHLSASGSLTKKNFEEGNTIAPKGFFLIWLGSSPTGSPSADMVWSSGSLNNASATISLVDNSDAVIDAAQYDVAQFPDFSAGKSLERKAFLNGVCVSAQNSGEYLGNGCDTDSLNDWETRSVPKPQNSQNLPEPRQVAAVEELNLTYNPSNLGISFEWETKEGLIYRLSDISNASSTLLIATSTGQFYKNITEVGREYKFEIFAVDREGLTSSSTQVSINAPSFFDTFVFYQDPRSSSSSPQYLLDLSWNNYPFVPIGQKWHTVVFYYNQDPAVTGDLKWINFHENELYKSWGLRDVPGGFWVNYPNCNGRTTGGYALVLPDDSSDCISFAVNQAGAALDWKQLEDKHLSLTAGAGNFASSSPAAGHDFVTAAFYTYVSGYEPNNYGSRLVAIDKTRHYFQNSSFVSQPPAAPQNLQAVFDQNLGLLNLTWDKSQDPDSLDNLITYEVSYSSTTIAATSNSVSISVDFAANYVFEIRAKDELGNLSDAAVLSYAVPDLPLPYNKLTSVSWGNLVSSSTVSLKLEFSDYQFMDINDPTAILFFVNQAAPANYSFLDDDYRQGGNIGGANNVLKLIYYPCDFNGQWTSRRTVAGLILRNKDCPNNANSIFISELLAAKIDKKDIEFIAEVVGNYNESDYVTLGFYKLGPRNPQTGKATFTNVANYNKKIYFQDLPQQ